MNLRTSLITLALLASLFTGCSKSSPDAAATRPNVPDLGVVEVSDGVPSRHDLGGGRFCVIKPALQKDGTISLAISIETTNATGTTDVLSTPTVITLPDRAVQASVGDIGIGFTPHIK